MKHPGHMHSQEKKTLARINLSTETSLKLDNSHGVSFPSHTTSMGATFRSRASRLSKNQEHNPGNRQGECKGKKAVLFSRDPVSYGSQFDSQISHSSRQSTHIKHKAGSNMRRSPSSLIVYPLKNNSITNTNTHLFTSIPGTSPARDASQKKSLKSNHLILTPRTDTLLTNIKSAQIQHGGLLSCNTPLALSDCHKSAFLVSGTEKGDIDKAEIGLNTYEPLESVERNPHINRFLDASDSVTADLVESIKAKSPVDKPAWIQNEIRINMKDDPTSSTSHQPNKLFGSSNVFQKVLVDMHSNQEYGTARCFSERDFHPSKSIALYASKCVGTVKVFGKLKNLDKYDPSKDGQTERNYRPRKEYVENAKRGWGMLKQYVHEMELPTRSPKATLNWDMFRHTLDDVTSLEHTRRDLYERYGIVPRKRSDGTVVQENSMLSDRSRLNLNKFSKNFVVTSTISRKHRQFDRLNACGLPDKL